MSKYSKDTTNKSFCILPFVHTHLNTEGDVYPCCVGWNGERTSKIGDLKDASLEELFNSDAMKQLRLDMINGIRRPEFCDPCYKREDSGFHSARHGNNDDYLDLEEEIVESMHSDGYLDPIIRSWDIRFSNLCNLKCRSCGDIYSSTWGAESEKFGDHSVGDIKSIPEGHPDPLEKQYGNVDKIYFAGGEPLIMPEHFRTLDKLVKSGQSKKIKLVYNTNMTKLNYNRHDLIEYWKEFKEVVLGMSIDSYGERAEYVRNGVKWSIIENNIKKISETTKDIPHISYHFSVTISLMNVYTLTDLHRYLYDLGVLPDVGSFLLNILLGPSYYEIKNLPSNIKEHIKTKIKKHLEWMDTIQKGHDHAHCMKSYESLFEYLDYNQNQDDINSFIRETKKLDERRTQSFPDTFPEYAEWWKQINQNIIDVKNI